MVRYSIVEEIEADITYTDQLGEIYAQVHRDLLEDLAHLLLDRCFQSSMAIEGMSSTDLGKNRQFIFVVRTFIR